MSGSISDVTCSIDSLGPNSKVLENKYGYGLRLRGITTDCRNDILTPKVKCACCSFCYNKSPMWASQCPDVTIKIKIHHKPGGVIISHIENQNSDDLVWSLKENTSGNPVVYDG